MRLEMFLKMISIMINSTMVKTISMMIPKIATTSAPTDKLEDGVVVVGGGVIVG